MLDKPNPTPTELDELELAATDVATAALTVIAAVRRLRELRARRSLSLRKDTPQRVLSGD